MSDKWIEKLEKELKAFSKKHKTTYSISKNNLAAAFEIGCFHALMQFYENCGYVVSAENLTKEGEYRYLTSPAGNPNNFSYVKITGPDGIYEIRQQVRVRSHIDSAIAFSPDLVVLKADTEIKAVRDPDYAKGKKDFYTLQSDYVVAAHECNSMSPFPELMVSYVGMLVTAHKWYSEKNPFKFCDNTSTHLAPTLFVGGCASGLHLKMIRAMRGSMPLNIIVGMHMGSWGLHSGSMKTNRLDAKKIFGKRARVKKGKVAVI